MGFLLGTILRHVLSGVWPIVDWVCLKISAVPATGPVSHTDKRRATRGHQYQANRIFPLIISYHRIDWVTRIFEMRQYLEIQEIYCAKGRHPGPVC